MRLTWCSAGSATDLTIRGLDPDATVGDLASSLSPSATQLWIDGRPHALDEPLAAVLRDGVVVQDGGLEEATGAASAGDAPTVATLHAVAGPRSGRS